jgi:1-acylglycerone phosphate reductase
MASTSKPPVVLITGCTLGGIGHALSAEFARRGCIVYATARSLQSIGPLAPEVRQAALDVSQPDSIKACVARVMQEEGRLDILINSAHSLGFWVRTAWPQKAAAVRALG